jgi:hypothetical protein
MLEVISCSLSTVEGEGKGGQLALSKERGKEMIDSKEKGTIIFALEQYAEALEGEGNYQAKNSVLEIIWKLDMSEREDK